MFFDYLVYCNYLNYLLRLIYMIILKATYIFFGCQLTVMDGNQLLDFYWLDPIEAIIRFVAKKEFCGKLYTQFVPGTSYHSPGQRAFDGCANCGMVFEAAQLIDLNSSPVLALFFSDAAFAGQHMTHHPIYRMSCLVSLFDHFNSILIIVII